MAPTAPHGRTSARAAAAVVALAVAVVAVAAVAVLDATPPADLLLQLGRFLAAAVVVVALPGVGLARRLAPARLGPWWPALVVPFGLAGAALGLTVLALVGLRPRPATGVFLLASLAFTGLTLRPGRARVPRADRSGSVALLAGAAGAGLLTLLPVLRAGFPTVPGENPDAHQVVGVAWFLQEAHPLVVDTATALDRVPAAWTGRIPIFPPYGAAIEVGVTGPVQMFAPFVAVLTVAVALGAGMLAAAAHRLPGWCAGLVALAAGGSAATLYSALHPYYNQLWGMALLLAALALAWTWLADGDGRAGALTGLFLLLALIAYPTTLPYAVLAVAAIAVAERRRPRVPPGLRRRLRRVWPLLLLFFGLFVLAAVGKLVGVLAQFVGNTPFWVGDVWTFPPHGEAFGVRGGSVLVPLLVAAAAALGLWRRSRHGALAWAALAAGLLAIDAVLRGRATAEYVDYKHVTFTALLLLPLALGGALAAVRGARRGDAAGADRAAGAVDAARADDAARTSDAAGAGGTVANRSPAGSAARRWVPAAVAGVALAAWAVPAVGASRAVLRATGANVTPELLDVQRWGGEIPRGSSVLLDLPASGTQLWATLFLGRDHPLAATDPVASSTTYSVAPRGRRADYVLGLRRDLRTGRPTPAPRWASGPPVARDDRFALWRMALPADVARTEPATASTRLVEPHPAPAAELARRARREVTGNPSRSPGF